LEEVLMCAQRRILIVDDDEILRRMFKLMLEQADYEVIVASDGVSGVEMSKSEKPDLVIIDGLMPKMHGFLACKVIKQLQHPPKVILLTGVYTKPSYRLEAKYEYKADEFLTKPINHGELLACVEKHLASLPKERPESQPRSASTTDYEVQGLPRPTQPAGYSATWKVAPSSKDGGRASSSR
jgi:two-component system alkaline phosphatase synthesis response regulator PhoP